MDKQTKILGIAALVIAGVIYWRKSIATSLIAKIKAEGDKAAADKAAADKAATEAAIARAGEEWQKALEEANKEGAKRALDDLMNPSNVSILSYQKYVMNPLEYNPDEIPMDYVGLSIPKKPTDYFYSLILTELDSNMNKVGNPIILDDAAPSQGEDIYGVRDGFFSIPLQAKPETKYDGIVRVLENSGMDNEKLVTTNHFIYSPNSIENIKLINNIDSGMQLPQ